MLNCGVSGNTNHFARTLIMKMVSLRRSCLLLATIALCLLVGSSLAEETEKNEVDTAPVTLFIRNGERVRKLSPATRRVDNGDAFENTRAITEIHEKMEEEIDEEGPVAQLRALKSKSKKYHHYATPYYKGKGYYTAQKPYYNGNYKGKGYMPQTPYYKGKGGYSKGKGYYKGKGKGYDKGQGQGYYKGKGHYAKGKGLIKGVWQKYKGGYVKHLPGGGYVKKVPKQNPPTPTLGPGPTLAPGPTPTRAPVVAPTLVPGSTAAPTAECTTCRDGCLFITDFAIVNADVPANVFDWRADILFSIEEGATYSLSNLRAAFNAQNFALVCITDPEPYADTPFPIGSVGLRDNNFGVHVGTAGNNSGKDYNSEGSPPYSLEDDDNGVYTATDFSIGTDWSITCQAFCERNLLGGESVPETRTFRMVA